MKSTGIVRPIDHLGRIVLPIELRRSFQIEPEDLLEIYVEKDSIILKKQTPSCVFCRATTNLTPYKDQMICKKCAAEIAEGIDG